MWGGGLSPGGLGGQSSVLVLALGRGLVRQKRFCSWGLGVCSRVGLTVLPSPLLFPPLVFPQLFSPLMLLSPLLKV